MYFKYGRTKLITNYKEYEWEKEIILLVDVCVYSVKNKRQKQTWLFFDADDDDLCPSNYFTIRYRRDRKEEENRIRHGDSSMVGKIQVL